MKTAFILHGFNGDTTYTFGLSLKEFLESKDYTVFMPNFPIRSEATFAGWSSILDEYKKHINSDSIIVAHSIGNPFIIKYFYNNNLNANLYISVAGFCDLFKVEGREDLNSAFIDFSVNNTHIEYFKSAVSHRFSLYSNNDHVIPFDILKSFIFKMESSPVFIENVGHMGNRDNISRLPQIEEIIENLD